MRLSREHPTIFGGIPVQTSELLGGLPRTRLNMSRQENVNNHHMAYARRLMGATAIGQTFRDLDIMQVVLPKDVHSVFHMTYEPLRRQPDQIAMLDIIDEQRAIHGLLRYGSANYPTYKGIDDELWHTLMLEYNDTAAK